MVWLFAFPTSTTPLQARSDGLFGELTRASRRHRARRRPRRQRHQSPPRPPPRPLSQQPPATRPATARLAAQQTAAWPAVMAVVEQQRRPASSSKPRSRARQGAQKGRHSRGERPARRLARPDRAAWQENTPLLVSCHYRHEATALMLLDRARIPRRPTSRARRLSLFAALEGMQAVAERLLESDATQVAPPACMVYSRKTDETSSRTPLQAACENGFVGCVQLLLGKGATPEPLRCSWPRSGGEAAVCAALPRCCLRRRAAAAAPRAAARGAIVPWLSRARGAARRDVRRRDRARTLRGVQRLGRRRCRRAQRSSRRASSVAPTGQRAARAPIHARGLWPAWSRRAHRRDASSTSRATGTRPSMSTASRGRGCPPWPPLARRRLAGWRLRDHLWTARTPPARRPPTAQRRSATRRSRTSPAARSTRLEHASHGSLEQDVKVAVQWLRCWRMSGRTALNAMRLAAGTARHRDVSSIFMEIHRWHRG